MNSDNKKYNYEWIYEEVEQSFILRRKKTVKNVEFEDVLIYLVVLLFVYIAVRISTRSISSEVLFFDAIRFLIFLYVLGIFSLVVMVLVESFNRNKSIEECLGTLRNERSNLSLFVVEKFERRANAYIGAARVFVILPGLILTFAGPVFFSNFANLHSPGRSTLLSKVFGTFRDALSSPNVLDSFFESGSFTVVLFVLLLVSFANLYLQLERANICTVIQHACIEFGAELEAQNTSSNNTKN